MLSLSGTEAWKLNTATSWRDRGTIKMRAWWSVPQGANGIPLHPVLGAITRLQCPGFSTCTSGFSLCTAPCYKGPSRSALSYQVSTVGLSGVGKVFSSTVMVSSDWNRGLPSLHPGPEKTKCWYVFMHFCCSLIFPITEQAKFVAVISTGK